MELIQMRTAKQIIEENKNNMKISFYWDMGDSLSDEQIMKVLKEEDGLCDVENDIWENNLDYIGEMEHEKLKEIMTEEEYENDELRDCVRGYIEIDMNIEQLIKNSQINLRVELLTNEDLIDFRDKKSYTLKCFKRVFKGAYSKEELDREILELMGTDYGLMTFYFRLRGRDILTMREQIQNGIIELRKGLPFGIFNFCSGSGSVLEMSLKKSVKIDLKDWRYKNDKEKAMGLLKEDGGVGYYTARVVSDNLNKYGIQETYGLGSWEEY